MAMERRTHSDRHRQSVCMVVSMAENNLRLALETYHSRTSHRDQANQHLLSGCPSCLSLSALAKSRRSFLASPSLTKVAAPVALCRARQFLPPLAFRTMGRHETARSCHLHTRSTIITDKFNQAIHNHVFDSQLTAPIVT